MNNSNSSKLKIVFEQYLPRLIALSIFAYLIYSLVFRADVFSNLHIGALIIMLVFVFTPMASRLKVLNWFDFSSKISDLKGEQEETKRLVYELKNQMSTFVSTSVNPVQIMTNSPEVLSEAFSRLLKAETKVNDTAAIEKGTKHTKEEFLRQAYGYRHRAYILLYFTIILQVAVFEHREFGPVDFIEGNTIDEKIPNLIKKVLEGGLDKVFPIEIVAEEGGESKPAITQDIIDNLQLMNSLIDLYQKVEANEIELPSDAEINGLFDNIRGALSTIAIALEVVFTGSLLYQYRMAKAIESLKREIGHSEAEQRPINIPPPNSG